MIILKDHEGAEERIQCLLKGPPIGEARKINLRRDLEEGLVKLIAPGIQPIKKIELAKKWGPLVPEEYRDAFCKPAERSDINKVKASRREKRKISSNKKKQMKQPTNENGSSATVDILNKSSNGEKKSSSSSTVTQAQPQTATGTRLCGLCKQPGHNKRTCPNSAHVVVDI